jgi:hypothetical protein
MSWRSSSLERRGDGSKAAHGKVHAAVLSLAVAGSLQMLVVSNGLPPTSNG